MIKNTLNKLVYRPNVMNDITVIVIVVSIAVAVIGSGFYATELYTD